MTKRNRSVAQRVLNVKVEADHHRRYHVWETPVLQYNAPLRPWRYESLRVSAVRATRLRIRDRMN
eukprot:3610218-Pleurochrysis_carterae.AAC.1